MPGGGGGVDLDVITAGAEDVLAGKVIVDKNGEPLTGTMADQGNWNFSELVAGSAVTVPGGKHGGGGKVTAKSLASQTPGDSAAGHILAGRTAWVNGSKITGTIPSQAGGTLTPSTSAVTANCSGKYMTSNYTIPAFALPPANALRKGYSYTLYGKTVTGTMQIFVNTPTNVTGNETGVTILSGSNTGSVLFTSDKKINFNSYSNQTVVLRLNTAVNLTDYKYLKFTIASAFTTSAGSSAKAKIGVATNSNGTGITYSNEVEVAPSSKDVVVVLDVTGPIWNVFCLYIELYNKAGLLSRW